MFQQDYTALAADYDQRRFDGPGAFKARADASIVQELVRLTRATEIYDIPVGTGRTSDYLRDSSVSIVGCDLTEAMLERAAARQGGAPMTLLRCDAADLPFPADSIDCIISLAFFHLIPHAQRFEFANEFTRVLKPGGHLICSFTNGWYGGGINWIQKCLGKNRLHFLKPGETKRLFPGFRVRAIRGNFWPFQRLVRPFGETVADWSIRLNGRFPCNRICWETFYLLQKGPA